MEIPSAQFFDSALNLFAGFLVETFHAQISHARLQQKRASYAGRLHLLWRECKFEQPHVAGAAYVELGRLLSRLGQHLDELLHIQPFQANAVDGQNFVAGAHAGFRRGRPRQRLQHDHPSGQHGNHAPKTFSSGSFQLLQLLELLGIKENRVGIQAPQHAGNHALIKHLLGGNRVGGILLHQRIDVHQSFDLPGQIFIGAGGTGSEGAG